MEGRHHRKEGRLAYDPSSDEILSIKAKAKTTIATSVIKHGVRYAKASDIPMHVQLEIARLKKEWGME